MYCAFGSSSLILSVFVAIVCWYRGGDSWLFVGGSRGGGRLGRSRCVTICRGVLFNRVGIVGIHVC